MARWQPVAEGFKPPPAAAEERRKEKQRGGEKE
jgi:hypothetical protein